MKSPLKIRNRKLQLTVAGLAAAAVAVTVIPSAVAAPDTSRHSKPTIVLEHGAWADGSSWAKTIPLLAAKGATVTAVQLPLTSFDADVAAVARAIALADGDVVLVGHSYAGAVIGQAGNDPKVGSIALLAYRLGLAIL